MSNVGTLPRITESALADIRRLDELVTVEARRLHVERMTTASIDYKTYTADGFYDDDPDLVTLRAAIRRGIEIGRAA